MQDPLYSGLPFSIHGSFFITSSTIKQQSYLHKALCQHPEPIFPCPGEPRHILFRKNSVNPDQLDSDEAS